MPLEEEIARAVGVILPDGRKYQRGAITSAGDVRRNTAETARLAELDAQTGPRSLGGFAGDSETRAVSARLNPSSNPNLRPTAGAIALSSLMASQPSGYQTSQPARPAASGLDLAASLNVLRSNAGRVPGRNYSQGALASATPDQILAEADRLPKLLQAQAGLQAAAPLVTDRDYSPAALVRATPEQLLAESSALPTRIEASKRKRQQDVNAAALKGIDSGAVASDPEARATQIDTAAQAAAQRVAAAGGSIQDAQAAASLIRQTLDPTGEIAYQRQLRRDIAQQNARLDLEEKRTDAREKARADKEDRAGLQFLRLDDEMKQAQQLVSSATALTPQQESVVLKQAMDEAGVGDGFLGMGNPRAKLKSVADVRRYLANDEKALGRFDEAVRDLSAPYVEANAATGAGLAAMQKLERATARMKALERRGIMPTDRSYELYDAERGAGRAAAGAPVVLDAATGQPVAAMPGPVSTRAVPAWAAAAGLTPAGGPQPAAGPISAEDLASIFPPAATSAIPAIRPVPTLRQAFDRQGLLALMPGGQGSQALAWDIAPAAGWLSNLGSGMANYLGLNRPDLIQRISPLAAAANFATNLPVVFAGDRGRAAVSRFEDGLAGALAAPSARVMMSEVAARNTQSRIASANRSRAAAVQQAQLEQLRALQQAALSAR